MVEAEESSEATPLLQKAAPIVSAQECRQHKQLLRCFLNLKQTVSKTKGLFKTEYVHEIKTELDPIARQSTVEERRWSIYVSRAIHRFSVWWTHLPALGTPGLESSQLSEKPYGQHGGWAWTMDQMPPLDIVEIFLGRGGMSERLKDQDYELPLNRAIIYGHIPILQFFLQRGVNPWYAREGYTALVAAVCGGHVEVVQLLPWDAEHRHLLDPGRQLRELGQALWTAAHYGNEELIHLLLAEGADVNFRSEDTIPLGNAVINGHYSTAKLLLQAGADPKMVDCGNIGLLARAAEPSVACFMPRADQAPVIPGRGSNELIALRQYLFDELIRNFHPRTLPDSHQVFDDAVTAFIITSIAPSEKPVESSLQYSLTFLTFIVQKLNLHIDAPELSMEDREEREGCGGPRILSTVTLPYLSMVILA
ncbi:ankyrin repeat domain-containing protein [Aspergillus thermomutatus]|uniref:Uncharacterized protein n=1 Tax=Aspergillus thermomutatus TaxID=41047 RepID=A0A397GUF1_ASPTH|nr:uncharacterized protein CDV56_105684 [Aspergillus thermomutatus]RHZ53919.1 hypothetical protein CDV56_105684 [Aspergillus thermomutatus]